MGQITAHKIVIRKPEGNRSLGWLQDRCNYNIKNVFEIR
jgi:hypothetical protein